MIRRYSGGGTVVVDEVTFLVSFISLTLTLTLTLLEGHLLRDIHHGEGG